MHGPSVSADSVEFALIRRAKLKDSARGREPEINERLPKVRPGASTDLLRMSAGTMERDAPVDDALRRLVAWLPRPFRFLGVGAIGLTTDILIFTILISYSPRPLLMRLFSLAIATLVTWRLNRALTFDRSGRRQGEEAMRYAMVTAVSQGTSYAVFAAFVLTVFAWLPQAAVLLGAMVGAVVGYNGHRLFAFAPKVQR
jgi:putative flippase GtrA